jgi:hypothetical protein
MQQISAKAMGEYRTAHQLEGLPKICDNKKRGAKMGTVPKLRS